MSKENLSLQFSCSCGKTYSSRGGLWKHKKRYPEEPCLRRKTVETGHIKCNDCTCLFRYVEDLSEHLESDHGVSQECKHLEFGTYSDFLSWKAQFQKETVSSFQKKETRKYGGTDRNELHYFYCSRSGYYNSRIQRKRKLKTQGLSKINSVCTARMKVTVLNSGTVIAKVWPNHYGHENELCHLRIPLSRRQKRHRITKCHAEAANLPLNLVSAVSESCWNVASAKSLELSVSDTNHPVYTVTLQHTSCPLECDHKCAECNVCAHMMSCTCPDAIACAGFTICKHIHLVNIFVTEKNVQGNVEERVETEVSYICTDGTAIEEVLTISVDGASREDSINHEGGSNEVQRVKESLQRQLLNLVFKVRDCDSIDILRKCVTHINSVISIIGGENSNEFTSDKEI